MKRLDEDKVRQFAKEAGGVLTSKRITWAGPPEAPENSLSIPLWDLGRTVEGVMYRVSLRPDEKNTLLEED